MKCSKCGTELLPGDLFCGGCGNRIVSETSVQQNEIVKGHVNIEIESEQPYQEINNFPYVENQENFPYEDRTKIFPNNKVYVTDTQSGLPKVTEADYDNELDDEPGTDEKAYSKKYSGTSVLAVILVIILLLFVLYTAFNYLIMTDKIDTESVEFLGSYKTSLSEFLNIPVEEEKAEEKYQKEDEAKEEKSETETETSETETKKTENTEDTSESSEETTESSIPEELQQYSNNLVPENRNYIITLKEDDWKINYRSEPKLIDVNQKPNNIIGQIKSGSKVYVEYIYNGTWVVFQKDGKYVFSSIYATESTSSTKLMVAE